MGTRSIEKRSYNARTGTEKTEKFNRKCLKCGKKFPSSGPENRLCEKCNSQNEKEYIIIEHKSGEYEKPLVDVDDTTDAFIYPDNPTDEFTKKI